jgi:hypothetical protein
MGAFVCLLIFVGSFDDTSAHGRGGLVSYSRVVCFLSAFMIAIAILSWRVTKTVSSEMLLCRTWPSRAIRKNSGGCKYFCRTNLSLYYHACKNLLCPLPRRRRLFFQIFPKAVLLTGRIKKGCHGEPRRTTVRRGLYIMLNNQSGPPHSPFHKLSVGIHRTR